MTPPEIIALTDREEIFRDAGHQGVWVPMTLWRRIIRALWKGAAKQ